MSITSIELFEILKPKLGEIEARTLVQYVESKVEDTVDKKKDTFLTKDDKVELIRTIYLVGLSQFIAIIVSILAIFNYMK